MTRWLSEHEQGYWRSWLAANLLERSVRVVLKRKKIALAALDSTGLEARHISRYFVRRKRSKQLETYEQTYYRRWPKLAVICDCRTHLVGARSSDNPRPQCGY